MSALSDTLRDAGGPAAPRSLSAQLRGLVTAALDRGAAELKAPRSGTREEPVQVVVAAEPGRLLAVVPVPVSLRADPEVVPERGWLMAAATVGVLADAAGLGRPDTAEDLALIYGGASGGHLLVVAPTTDR